MTATAQDYQDAALRTMIQEQLDGTLRGSGHGPLNYTDALSRLRTLEALLNIGADAWGRSPNAGASPSASARDLYNNTPDGFPEGAAGGGGDGYLRVAGVGRAGGHWDTSCQAESFLYVDYTQTTAVRNAFIALYALVVVLSVTGNLMVIWTVWRKKHMRTVTNYYIVNLAMSDFLVALFVVPLKLLEYTAPCSWKVLSNDTLCSALSFVLPVFVFSSVLTLVAISLERYYAIVHPLSSIKIHCKSRTRKIIALTWVVAVIMAGPYVYYKSYPFVIYSHLGSLSGQICTDRFDEIDFAIYRTSDPSVGGRFRKGFFLFLFVTIYLTPTIIIITTSVRIALCLLQPIAKADPNEYRQRVTQRKEESKRKVALMMIVVAAGFVIAWTPFYVITFISQVQRRSFLRESNYLFTMLLIHWFGFLNSCVNPVIYNFMNDKFHRSFRQLLSICRLPFLQRSRSTRWTRVSLTPRQRPSHPLAHAHCMLAADGSADSHRNHFEMHDIKRAGSGVVVGSGAANGGPLHDVVHRHSANYCKECSSSPIPASSSETPEPSRGLYRSRY